MTTVSGSEPSASGVNDPIFPELVIDIFEPIEHARLHGFDPIEWLEQNVFMAWDLADLNQSQVVEIYERVTEFAKHQPTSFILVGLMKGDNQHDLD
jgi:hypothetical protein